MDALLAAAVKEVEEEFARKIEERRESEPPEVQESRVVAENRRGDISGNSKEAESRSPEYDVKNNEETGRKAAEPVEGRNSERESTKERQEAERDQNSETSSTEENPETKAA